ncbi:MAG: thrombospondin type 3 repeat-containing protein, partial [Desulfobulbaceae bacterium]|nr:thrombospondin type 3 repeat-containing protein [Desulfobulbaceae bacterium]
MRQTDWSGGNKEEAIAKAATALIDELWTAIAVDSDGDTVFDHRDRCPGTPAGIAVDNLGCPGDEDRDKVPDYLDECPRTPAGAPVDKRGCPKDSDNDGVPDYLDGCADTPAGLTVDGKGCPPDGDDDGVADYLDKCPDTPAGRLVDEAGCPRPLKETVSQELRVEFAFNSAEINSCYHDHLRRVAEF